MPQTSWTQSPALGIEGQVHTGRPHKIVRRAADSAVRFGLVVTEKDTEQCEVIPVGSALAATAIIASGVASATSVQRIVAASMNGSVGAAYFAEARNAVITLNAHADWDQSIMILQGKRGSDRVLEVFDVPANTGATLVGHQYFNQFEELLIQPQTGTNGTVTLGLGVEYGAHTNVIGIAIADTGLEGPSPGVSAVGYAALEEVSILTEGLIWVTSWDAVTAGQPAYVRRVVADSGRVLGSLGGSADGTLAAPECAPLIIGGKQAVWRSAADAAGFALLEIG